MPDLLTIVEQFRAAMERQDEAALKRLIDVYGRSYKRLDVLAQSLAERIADSAPTQAQVTRMMQYKALQEQMIEELTGIQAITRDMVAEQGALNVAMGERDAARMVGAALTGEPVILPGFNRLNPEAITALLGFLSPEGELYKRIGELAGSTAEYVTEKMLEGITLGYNPRKIAQAFQDSYGRGLTDALRMVRTAQLYSYREANRASYTANSDVVKGWQWGATLDGLTCMSCVAQHGTIHKLDERLNDHHVGRCAMIPITILFPPAISETGEEWFSKQPEAMQRQMMGQAKYQAWIDGKFSFDKLSGVHNDNVFGNMRIELSLKAITGEETVNPFSKIRSIDPNRIETINPITDRDKYKALVLDMSKSGWRGREILVIENEGSYQALTGSHRVYAAREAGINVKARIINTTRLTEDQINELIDARDDTDRLALLRYLKDSNGVTKQDYELMKREIEENIKEASVSYKKEAAIYDKLIKEREAAEAASQALEKKLAQEAAEMKKKERMLSQDMKEYEAYLEILERKYKNIYAEMSDSELELLEKLEKKAYKG